MAFIDCFRNNTVSTPWKDIESTICLLTEWTLKACGLFEADSEFLIKKGAYICSSVHSVSIGRSDWHAPK